jgi:hypothetical protein
MTAEALQLNAALTNATRRVERLTSVAGGALQIFLFELTSVTMAHTCVHSRATNDYEINLEKMLSSLDPSEVFCYFYFFFRAGLSSPQKRLCSF